MRMASGVDEDIMGVNGSDQILQPQDSESSLIESNNTREFKSEGLVPTQNSPQKIYTQAPKNNSKAM